MSCVALGRVWYHPRGGPIVCVICYLAENSQQVTNCSEIKTFHIISIPQSRTAACKVPAAMAQTTLAAWVVAPQDREARSVQRELL
eukprot:4700758-Amphidinium_carterae.1